MACLYQKLKQIEVTSLMKLQSHLKFEYFINISHLQIIFRFAPELISVASLFQLTSWLVASLLAAESHSNERSPFFFFFSCGNPICHTIPHSQAPLHLLHTFVSQKVYLTFFYSDCFSKRENISNAKPDRRKYFSG